MKVFYLSRTELVQSREDWKSFSEMLPPSDWRETWDLLESGLGLSDTPDHEISLIRFGHYLAWSGRDEQEFNGGDFVE